MSIAVFDSGVGGISVLKSLVEVCLLYTSDAADDQ